MRSCVDFHDPSDHSTIMSVQGLSSAEKKISFFEEGDAIFSEKDRDFLAVAINK